MARPVNRICRSCYRGVNSQMCSYPARKWRESVLSVTESCRPGERVLTTGPQANIRSFYLGSVPNHFFVDFVIGAILTQRFQRAADFLAQFIAAFGKATRIAVLPSDSLNAPEPAVACGFDKVQDARRIVQNGVPGAVGAQFHAYVSVINVRTDAGLWF